jgi:hypothetical protein
MPTQEMNTATDHTRFIDAKASQYDAGKSLVIYINQSGIPVEVYTYLPDEVEAAFRALGFRTYHVPRTMREQAI